MTEVADGLQQDFSNRVLEPDAPVHAANDGQLFSIGRPIRRGYVFQNFARRTADERRTRESAVAYPEIEFRAERNCELTLRGDRENVGIG